MLPHVDGVDDDLLARLVGGIEGNVVEDALHHRREPPRTDIFDGGVHLDRDIGDGVDRVGGEFEIEAFGLHQRDILFDEAGLRLGKDAAEIVARERAKLDPDGKPALKLGQKVRGLGDVERARGDEQDVVGLHRPVFGADGRALDQRQEIALHAFAADIGADALRARADLVDLVEEDDAVILDVPDRLLHDHVAVDQLVGFLAQENVEGIAHGDLARLGARAEGFAQHVGKIDHADLAAGHAGDLEGRHRRRIGDLDLDLAVVELARAQTLAEGLAGRERCARADQSVEHALLGIELGLGGDLFALGIAHEPDARFEQIAHDLIDVAADVTHFGEFGGLDLDEGRARELGQAPRNLSLADAGRADHEDVLGQNLLAHVLVELLPAPAIAERDGDGALGVALTDDVAVELGDDLAGGKTGHRYLTRYLPVSSVSTTTSSLV